MTENIPNWLLFIIIFTGWFIFVTSILIFKNKPTKVPDYLVTRKIINGNIVYCFTRLNVHENIDLSKIIKIK